ncbi:hypothetical protein ACHWQZ_G007946 [Mnemiopsis leidyi]
MARHWYSGSGVTRQSRELSLEDSNTPTNRNMFHPVSMTTQSEQASCGTCGKTVPIASLTTWLEMCGVDYQEWDDTEINKPYRRAEQNFDKPDHRERKFFEWSRGHGLSDDTVFTLLSYNIKRIATLRNTPVEFLDEMELSKGQKIILRSLMVDDWSCSFCGTYHTSPKNSCSLSSRRPGASRHVHERGGSLKHRAEKHKSVPPGKFPVRSGRTGNIMLSPRCNSLPDDELFDYDSEFEEDPLEAVLKRGRRNTTGQNFGYLNCHPKYWADILPVPSKLIKML